MTDSTLSLLPGSQATIVLSDIHIGDNYRTCWYQPEVHEVYLQTLLEWIIRNKEGIKEVVILGDLFDFWTYPPNIRPPDVAAIVMANSDILGPGGKMSEVLAALDGRVKYMIGNHDMTVVQADLDLVGDLQGYHPQLIRERYYVDHDLDVQYTHGHYTTLFNAPDEFNQEFGGLPLGHFVTRAIAYKVDLELEKLKPEKKTAADLSGQGVSYGVDFSAFFRALEDFFEHPSIARTFLDYVIEYTGIPRDTPVVLADGETVEIGRVGDFYADLWSQWVGQFGLLYTYKAAWADYDGSYMGWFSLLEAFRNGVGATIKGHTHIPKLGLPAGMDVSTMNTGFECPARPDMTRPQDPLAFSFGVVQPGQNMIVGQVLQSVDGCSVHRLSVPVDWVVSPDAAGDFSCYVTVICPAGVEAARLQVKATEGSFVAEPPMHLGGGATTTYRFWLQDTPGLIGSKGSVEYLLTAGPNAGQEITLSFECPTVFSNACGGAEFLTKSGDEREYGAAGVVARRGHPFYVQFSLQSVMAKDGGS